MFSGTYLWSAASVIVDRDIGTMDSLCLFNTHLLNVYCVSDSVSTPAVGSRITARDRYTCPIWRFPSSGRRRKN